MCRFTLTLIAVVLLFMAGNAGAVEQEQLQIGIDFGVGYRTDKIDWNIAGELAPGVLVDPLGGDTWENIDSLYSKATIRMSYKKFYARGSLGYGRIVDAGLQESVYAASGRQSEFSRLLADSEGYVFDSSIGVGYQITTGKVLIVPLIGYSWHVQYLETSNGRRVLCDTAIDPTCTLGRIADLNWSDKFRWQGPWLGFDFNLSPSEKAHFFATLEYHIGDYRAKDRWPSRNLGFDHIADAEGYVISAGFTYIIKDSLDIGVEAQYTQWKSDAGLHGFVGEFDILNEANWESLYIMLNLTHRFYELNQNKRLRKF